MQHQLKWKDRCGILFFQWKIVWNLKHISYALYPILEEEEKEEEEEEKEEKKWEERPLLSCARKLWVFKLLWSRIFFLIHSWNLSSPDFLFLSRDGSRENLYEYACVPPNCMPWFTLLLFPRPPSPLPLDLLLISCTFPLLTLLNLQCGPLFGSPKPSSAWTSLLVHNGLPYVIIINKKEVQIVS